MPHISTKRISDDDFKKIYDQLISLFDTAGTKRRSDLLLKELLTETEKIMLAKRLAVLCMLDKGLSAYYISQILQVSTSTVDRIELKYEIGGYGYISEVIAKNRKTIWDSIEQITLMGMPRRVGKDRWKWLEEMERKRNRKIMKS